MTGGRTKRRWWSVAAVLLLTAAWITVWHELEDSPLTRVPRVDERAYVTRSFEISQGSLVPDEPYYMSPLYPYLVWLTKSARELDSIGVLSGSPPLGIRILQAVLWFCTAIFLHRASTRLLPGRWAWVPPLLWLLYRPAAALVNTTLVEIPLTFCAMAALVLATAERPTWARAVLIGSLIGLATLLRGHALLLSLPVLAGLWWTADSPRRFTGRSVAMLAMAGLVLLPFVIHNSRAAGRLAGVSMNAGINLYFGNGPQAHGFFATGRGLDFGNDPTGAQWFRDVTGREVHGRAEVDRAWVEESLRIMREDPLRTLRLWSKKVWLHWIWPEIPQVSPLDAWGRHSQILRLLLLPYGIVSALGLAGLLLLGWRRQWRVWALAIGTIVATQSVFLVISRYRIILVPLLALLATGFVVELSRRRGRHLVKPLVLLGVCIAVVQPWGQRKLLNNLDSAALAAEAGRWLALGQHEFARDEVAAAHRAWEESASLFRRSAVKTPQDADVHRGLARSEFLLGDGDAARRTLERGRENVSPEDRIFLERDLIRLSVQLGEQHRAMEELATHTQSYPDDLEMIHLRITLLARSGQLGKALPLARRMVDEHPGDVRGYRDLSRLLASGGQLQEAMDVASDGLRRFPDDRQLRELFANLREDQRTP